MGGSNLVNATKRRYLLCVFGGLGLTLGIVVTFLLLSDIEFDHYFVKETQKIQQKIVSANISFGINLNQERPKVTAPVQKQSVIEEITASYFEGRFYPGQMRPLTDAESIEFDLQDNPIPNTMGEFMANPIHRHNAMDLDLPFPTFDQHKKNVKSVIDTSRLSTTFLNSVKQARDAHEIDRKLDGLMKAADDQIAKTAILKHNANRLLTRIGKKAPDKSLTEKSKSKQELDLDMMKADLELKKLSFQRQQTDGFLNALGHVMETLVDSGVVMVSIDPKPLPNKSDTDEVEIPSVFSGISFDTSNFKPFFSPARFAQVSPIAVQSLPQSDVAFISKSKPVSLSASVTKSPKTKVFVHQKPKAKVVSQSHSATVTPGPLFFGSFWDRIWPESNVTMSDQKKQVKEKEEEEGFFGGLFTSLLGSYYKDDEKSGIKSLDSTEDGFHGKQTEGPGDKALKDRIVFEEKKFVPKTESPSLDTKYAINEKKNSERVDKLSRNFGNRKHF
jgi:hypothetical protein